MAKTEFLKTEQKNEHIQFTNFDMSHKNLFTTNLGQILPTMYEPILPNDSADYSANDEIICQALENPSFSKFKLCHKSFYMPNTVLWKYWDRFITNKPDYTWTNSSIQDYIDNTQPYTPPYFTFKHILPMVSFARGYITGATIGFSIQIDKPGSSHGFYYLTSDNKKVSIFDILNCYGNFSGSVDQTSDKKCFILLSDLSFATTLYDITGYYDSNGTYKTKMIIDSALENAYSNLLGRIYHEDSNTVLTAAEKQGLKWKLRPFLVFACDAFKHFDYSIEKKKYNIADISHLKVTDLNESRTSLNYIGDCAALASGSAISLADVDTLKANGYTCLPIPPAYEASQYNMTPLAYLWYLCRNATKLLDSFGIPVYTETLRLKDMKFDSLPFFCYSKIYHEFFAHKQFQVNCPDWSEANGPISPAFDTVGDEPSSHYTNGWILHHPEIPYNVNYMQYDEKLIVRNSHMARCLMLGIYMNDLLFSSPLNPSTDLVYERTNKALTHTYMNYNGLLHLQYSNFPPDYFTEVLLDPLAGAKDIQIPTTITQLQEKSKLQDFLNQTSWTRNIKEWLQSQWSAISHYTTVTEPSLCGSCDVDINISQVLQTSETANTPLGTRAGVGSGYGHGKLVDRQFGEYGILLNLSYVVMDTMYINRVDVRNRLKSTRFDYPLPQFANLGNEKVLRSEVQFVNPPQMTITSQSGNFNFDYYSSCPVVPGFKADNAYTADDIMNTALQYQNDQVILRKSVPNTLSTQDLSDNVFGYIPRYSIYKHHIDEVHGDFLGDLKTWVPTREFSFNCLPNYCFISYELASETCSLLKNFVNMDTFGDDNFLVNQTNISHMRRALPYIVKPSL